MTAWKWKFGIENERRKVSEVKANVRGFQAPHGMMHQGVDLKVKWRHVGNEARLNEVVGIAACDFAVIDSTVEETCYGPNGLQESRYAEIIKGYGH